MKQGLIKNILLVCIVVNLTSSSSYAAVGDWFARQKQRSSEYVLRKINEAEQKTKELLASLRANSSCLVRGDCPPERKKKLRTIAGAIAAAVLIIAAVAIGSRYMQEDETGQIVPVSREAIPNIQTVIGPFNVKFAVDDKAQNMFLLSVYNGGLAVVKRYADLVKRNVLKAGIALANAMKGHFIKVQDMKKAEPYPKIANHITWVEEQFNLEQQKVNDLLVHQAGVGVLAKVQELYCHEVRPTPSENAVAVAREVAEYKGNKNVADYLRNPTCPAGAAIGRVKRGERE